MISERIGIAAFSAPVIVINSDYHIIMLCDIGW